MDIIMNVVSFVQLSETQQNFVRIHFARSFQVKLLMEIYTDSVLDGSKLLVQS